MLTPFHVATHLVPDFTELHVFGQDSPSDIHNCPLETTLSLDSSFLIPQSLCNISVPGDNSGSTRCAMVTQARVSRSQNKSAGLIYRCPTVR